MKGLTDLLELGNADKIGDFVIFHMFQKPFRRESMKKKTVWKRMETALKWQSSLKKANICLSMIDGENGSTVQNTVFFKKSVPKSLAKFRGKHMCRNLFLIKLESHSLLIY